MFSGNRKLFDTYLTTERSDVSEDDWIIHIVQSSGTSASFDDVCKTMTWRWRVQSHDVAITWRRPMTKSEKWEHVVEQLFKLTLLVTNFRALIKLESRTKTREYESKRYSDSCEHQLWFPIHHWTARQRTMSWKQYTKTEHSAYQHSHLDYRSSIV